MNFREYLWMLVKAYNPNQYAKMLERPARDFFVFLFTTACISLVIFIATLLPVALNFLDQFPETASHMQEFRLNASVRADQPIVFVDRPSVVLDLEANQTRSGDILLTNQGIIYPRYLFFGAGTIPWGQISDFKNQSPARDNILAFLVVFLLPSVIFWLFFVNMLMLLLVFVGLVLLGYLLPRLMGHRIGFTETMKVGILSLPSLFIIDVGLYPLAPLFWWALLLTTIFFAIGVALICEPKTDKRPVYEHQARQARHGKV